MIAGSRMLAAWPPDEGQRRPGRGPDGMFDDHHGELAQMLLDQIAFCEDRPLARITGWSRRSRGVGIDGDGTATGPARAARGGESPASPTWPASSRQA